MNIQTELYQFAHGKKPRGFGLWAFVFQLMNGEKETHFISGTYGKAKKEAVEIARVIGAYRVQVGS